MLTSMQPCNIAAHVINMALDVTAVRASQHRHSQVPYIMLRPGQGPQQASTLSGPTMQPLLHLCTRPPLGFLFLQVIPCPNSGKNTSSNGSSEQTGTQRTEPSADYVPPSTRTATGSLPSRSRSSYSWASDGQAPGPQGADKLTRTASNAAAAGMRGLQPTPQVRMITAVYSCWNHGPNTCCLQLAGQ
jgi:hypothetical protein